MSDMTPVETSTNRRDTIRSKILASRKPKSVIIDFFDTQIEIRQPTFGSVLSAQTREDRRSAVLNSLIENAYVPGTEDRVFTIEDEAELLLLPMGADLLRVSQALEDLSDVNFQNNTNTSGGTPPQG